VSHLWRTLATTNGFPSHLQHACGAELELVAGAPHEGATWQIVYGGKHAEMPGRYAPTDRAEAWLAGGRLCFSEREYP
jgi:hypothetical protein